MDDWKYIYLEQEAGTLPADPNADQYQPKPIYRPVDKAVDPNAGLQKKYDVTWESQIVLPPAVDPRPHISANAKCDPNNPRLYHMFWTGPFTDKPYMALLSFLFTQNTGIHLDEGEEINTCSPQFWLWINPGPAAAVPNPNALKDMFEQLKTNPWASPFLHPRFKDVIKFKMWNTTEQLDGVPEIKDEWRELSDSLFNSGGHIMSVPKKKADETSASENATSTASASNNDDDDMANRLGSKSSSSYDRLSVILSDMARFVLCHRFGGIYLDADTIFLRDCECSV
jgi:DDB1- and CUL4-associated factor 13